MDSLSKNLRPWSILWIIQRFIAVVKERRLPQIRIRDLLYDFKLTRKINARFKKGSFSFESILDNFEDNAFNFVPSHEYQRMEVLMDAPPEELSELNRYFDHVYVLNLGRRIDRRVEIIQKLIKYHIRAEIFEAEDGYTPENQSEFLEYYQQPLAAEGTHPLERSLRKKMIVSPGAWGYLKSYQKVLLDAQKNNFKRILCFDDDVLFHINLESMLDSSVKNIPSDWKLLYLGATQHLWDVPKHLKYPDRIGSEGFDKVPFYYPVRTDGSFAIGIDSSVFNNILESISQMNCSLDSGPLRDIQQKYPDECFVLMPNLVVADVSKSDIGVERDQEHMAAKLHWRMSLYDYPFRKELVSVVMPAFNAEKTIEKSIRSILLQNYRELEMIVADDGSTDRTAEIVQKMAREDSRVRLIRLESNQGCYPARNAAIRASKGKYIAIQDSDDISLSTRIEAQLIPLLIGKAEFTLTRIFRSRCTIDELDVYHQKDIIRLVLDRRIKTPAGLFEYRDQPVIGFMTTMFKRSLFEELGLFWNNRFGADAEFLERVLFHKAGILLSKKEGTIHSYLLDKESIPGIYQRVDKVQLISPDMTGDNITNRHSREEKFAYQELWRKRLKGEIDYKYPVFNQVD
jgi:glycosyltransferase involved in cell wall biosynthesis